MTTPRSVDIIPNCGLKIQVDKSSFEGIDHTNSSIPWKYDIVTKRANYTINEDVIPQEFFRGYISPTSRITLPLMVKKDAGIPKDATSFAFMYPPEGLAEVFQNADDSEAACHQTFDYDSTFMPPGGILSAITLGGFVYFDDAFNCISISALSRSRSNLSRDKEKPLLRFSGPFLVNKSVCPDMHNMGLTQPLRLDIFREVGFASFAWVRPGEEIRFKTIFTGYKNIHGALLFFRENGTAVAYAVDPSEYADPNGHVCFISDAIRSINEAKYNQKAFPSIYEVGAWGVNIKTSINNSVDTARATELLEDKNTLLHMACHAGLGADFIAGLLTNTREKSNSWHQDGLEKSNLRYQDRFGWNPLHYACRFSPSDHNLIKLLIDGYPDAVLQHDHCDRYPLHIACDSNASKDVITMLLAADTSISKTTISNATQRFGFLPIHLACCKGASHSIIKALLDADIDGWTAITKTKYGQLPLHIAIQKKLPVHTVKMLIDADSKLQSTEKYDVYQPAGGKLPIHIACWNNSASDIIEMLLEKDKNNTTIDETTSGAPTGEYGRTMALEQNIAPAHLDLAQAVIAQNEHSCAQDGVVPLHLAMCHGSTVVISLLLQKEVEKKDSDQLRIRTMQRKDEKGRTPLHIACKYGVDSRIIRLLLELDPLKETTQFDDDLGFRPMHYACEMICGENINAEVIKILCDAEEQCIKKKSKRSTHIPGIPIMSQSYLALNTGATNEASLYDSTGQCIENMLKVCSCSKKRSTHTGDNERNRTPLFLAVKSGAPTEVINRLLRPENFTLIGFDDPAMTDLADIVKDCRVIQDRVIDKMVDRVHFSIIILELYANVIVIASFMIGLQKLLDPDTHGRITWTEPSLLAFCAILFMLREILQITSVGTDYIGDFWSWYELIGIILLLCTASHMLEKVDNQDLELNRYLLSWTSCLLLVNVIFFLRSTFLPFARFVGGLLIIVKCLMPFIIVSYLLSLIFINSFWIHGICGNSQTFKNCSQILFGSILNFERDAADVSIIVVLFGFAIIVVLLNVVIAIVGEAWATAADRSTQLFWKSRLFKISEVRCADKFRAYIHLTINNVENMKNVSYTNEVSWTKAPFDSVTKKVHYDKPHEHFDSELASKIEKAKSLQADLYWASANARYEGIEFTNCDKINIILKWLGTCTLYVLLLLVGIATGGIFWPRNFRAALLSLDIRQQNQTRSKSSSNQ